MKWSTAIRRRGSTGFFFFFACVKTVAGLDHSLSHAGGSKVELPRIKISRDISDNLRHGNKTTNHFPEFNLFTYL